MKIRILDNNIRFQLKQPELINFGNTGILEQKIDFGSEEKDQVNFTLKKTSNSFFEIFFSKNVVTACIPGIIIDEWVKTDLAGFDKVIPLKSNKYVSLKLEKDFTPQA